MFDSFETGSGGKNHALGRKLSLGSTFTKVFRWRLTEALRPQPASVELAGTFTGWQRRPLNYDERTKSWELTLGDIPGHRTHRYVLLIDGLPEPDKNCDGLAVPEGEGEQWYQFMTARGPRVCLLFAQAK